jgi:hypothetical protein
MPQTGEWKKKIWGKSHQNRSFLALMNLNNMADILRVFSVSSNPNCFSNKSSSMANDNCVRNSPHDPLAINKN